MHFLVSFQSTPLGGFAFFRNKASVIIAVPHHVPGQCTQGSQPTSTRDSSHTCSLEGSREYFLSHGEPTALRADWREGKLLGCAEVDQGAKQAGRCCVSSHPTQMWVFRYSYQHFQESAHRCAVPNQPFKKGWLAFLQFVLIAPKMDSPRITAESCFVTLDSVECTFYH